MKILIVEDEAIIAESLFQLLILMEYQPLEPVSTPEDAIALIRQASPDLILLDITLQNERSGLEIAAFIQNEKLKIPYIILTAHTDPSTIAIAKKYRPAAYLVKPFMRDSLFAAIEIATPSLIPTDQQETEVFIKTGNKHENISLNQLIYLKSNGKYTELHFVTGKRLIRMPLSVFIANNSSINLLRVHKTFAVNPNFIQSYSSDELVVNDVKIPIGRFFMPDVYTYLKKRSIN